MLNFEAIGAAIGQARAVDSYNAHLAQLSRANEAFSTQNDELRQEIANLKILLMKKTCYGEAVVAQLDAVIDELRRVNPGNALFIKTGRKHTDGQPETRLGAIFPKAYDAAAIKLGLPNYKSHRVEAV